MEFQVRKGLETPLKVHGMNTRFFLVYCIILAVLVLFIVGFLTNAMSGEGSFVMFIVARFFRDVYSCFDGGRTCFCLLTCAVYQSFH